MTPLKSQRNPYIIGRPINEQKCFYGRDKELSFVLEKFKQEEKVVFLHGERRIGKSSVLQNIPEFLNEKGYKNKFACVSFELEYYSQDTLEILLEKLAETIVKQLHINPEQIEIPSAEEIKFQKDIFCNKFLPQIQERLKETKLVLLLDEFDALDPTYIGATVESLFRQLQKVVQNNKQLFAVIFAGRKSTDVLNLSKIFHKVPIAEIGLLDKTSAEKLIREPAAALEYTQKSIEAILNLSSGHPYFIQIICFALFSRARELEKPQVTEEDVEVIIERAVELAEAGLAWYWEALSVPEKLVFATVAEAEKIANKKQDQNLSNNPLILLKSYNLLSEEELKIVSAELANRGFLNTQGNKIKIELVGRWLVQRHPLWQEIREFEKTDKQEITKAYEILNETRQITKKVITATTVPNQQQSDIWEKRSFNQHSHNKYEDGESVLVLKGSENLKGSANKIYQNIQENRLIILMGFLGIGAIAAFIAFISPMVNHQDDKDYSQPVKEVKTNDF